MIKDLRAWLANPEVYPVELTLSSGQTILIKHPDYVHYFGPLNKVCIYPESGSPVFDWVFAEQIASVRARVRKGFWAHFFKGSRE
ncbi:MAG: hypothetical protein JWM32_710 [Verrucomicrobia bacterium]|nr:hypothetical protein [Verrucomicrobiota bacterium]